MRLMIRFHAFNDDLQTNASTSDSGFLLLLLFLNNHMGLYFSFSPYRSLTGVHHKNIYYYQDSNTFKFNSNHLHISLHDLWSPLTLSPSHSVQSPSISHVNFERKVKACFLPSPKNLICRITKVFLTTKCY